MLRQLETILLREDRLYIEDPQFIEGGTLHLLNKLIQCQIDALPPVVLENVRKQQMLAILQGLRLHAHKFQQSRYNACEMLSQALFVFQPTFTGGGKRLKNADWNPGLRARCVNREIN